MRSALRFGGPDQWSGFLLLVAGLTLGLAGPVAATHLRGGEAHYRYLDAAGTTPGRPFRYEITFSIYYNCDLVTSNYPCGRSLIGVMIYDKATGQRINDPNNPSGLQALDTCAGVSIPTSSLARASSYALLRVSDSVVTMAPPVGCNVAASCARVVHYRATVELPTSAVGYAVLYSDNARNANVTNIATGMGQQSAQVIQIEIPRPTAAYINTSPVFTDSPVPLICALDTVTIINNAVDADGDRLAYSLYAPFAGPTTPGAIYVAPTPVGYNPTYSFSQPFGAGGYVAINPLTGQTRYYVPSPGEYVVGLQVTEYRLINGQDVLLSSVYREIQLQVKQCGSGGSATFPPPTIAPATGQNLVIEEGDSIAPITVTGAILSGGALTLSVASPLLDGAGGASASFGNLPGTAANAPVVLTATGPTTGSFRYASACGSAGVYNVNFKVADLAGCPVKETPVTYLITVRRPGAATAISGAPSAGCTATRTYTAVGAPATTAAYHWTTTGGTIQGSATGPVVSVLWNTIGSHWLSVRAVSPRGCLSDARMLSVLVRDSVLALPAEREPLTLSVLPNPTLNGRVTVRLTGDAAPTDGTRLTLTVRSLLGQVVARRTLTVRTGAEAADLDLSALPRGVYSVQAAGPSPTLRGTTRLLRD